MNMLQTVILKWETDHIEGKPANVHLRKWLPQADLLAHPNLKAFVYSAGYYSFEESIFYRKPGVRKNVSRSLASSVVTTRCLPLSIKITPKMSGFFER